LAQVTSGVLQQGWWIMPSVLGKLIDLKHLTTLKVGGPAEVWDVETLDDLKEATRKPYRIIGAGSNLLVSDTGVKERIIKLGQSFNSLKQFSEQTDFWLGAATPLPGLVRRAQQFGLSGLEGLLGVPAVLGGAIAMNAGTRFGEMSDTLREVEIFLDNTLERLPASALNLGYRHSKIPKGAIITRARLELRPSTPEKVRALLNQVDAARKTQPKTKSAGCAFKNPPGNSAGKLIDQAGLKGLRVGDAMVSLEHGNFIVNLGCATSDDVLKLCSLILEKIEQPLELEWQLWGF
jgi:UDP-N-acetylmuramate dehydrogenase